MFHLSPDEWTAVLLSLRIALWATEFAWAERLLVWTMRQVREYSARIKSWWVRRRGADV